MNNAKCKNAFTHFHLQRYSERSYLYDEKVLMPRLKADN